MIANEVALRDIGQWTGPNHYKMPIIYKIPAMYYIFASKNDGIIFKGDKIITAAVYLPHA